MIDREPDGREGGDFRLIESARGIAAGAWHSARALVVGYLVVMVLEALFPVAAAGLTKAVVDSLVGSLAGTGDVAALGWLAAGLAAVGVVAAVASHSANYLSAEIGRRMSADLTDHLFAVATKRPGIRQLEDPGFLDRLRLAREGAAMAGGTVTGAFAVGRALLIAVGFVGALLTIAPWLALIVLASAVPAMLAHLHLSRRRAGMAWRLSPVERWQFVYADLLGSVDAAKEIRLFGSGGFLRARMMGYLRSAMALRREMDRRELFVQGSLAVMSAVLAGGGLIWTIGAARAGGLSPGDVTMFISATAAMQGSLISLVTSVAAVHHGLLLNGHHLVVDRTPPDLPVPARPRPLPALRSGVELRDVWFRYSPDHPWILRGVNAFIPAGRTIALVGLNGAGKSTLVKLLCRFYDPDRGSIRWDGVDLRDVAPEQLRDRISGVFQDQTAYDLTAADNVAIADISGEPDLPRIRAAARRAGVDEVLDGLPHGYATLLTRMFFGEEDGGATGVVLSGGQWQRVALARAYFRDRRDLMILDEPSAGLDPRAEAELHDQIRRHRAGRTSLLISHRLNTVREADLLFVLRDGVVIEQGTHEDLMRTDGAYARLFRLQASGYQLDASAGPLSHPGPAGAPDNPVAGLDLTVK